MDAPLIRVLDDPAAVALEAAREFVALARCPGRFRVALAGGSTPRTLYHLLATRFRNDVDWNRVEAYFGDERCVGPDHEHSNHRMARESLLRHVPIGAVLRIEGESGADAAADRYDRLLRALGEPLFDLVLLGMGADGHTLSLFPGYDPRSMEGRLAVPALAPPEAPVRQRVTLTPQAVARSRVALFLVTGADKALALRRVREHATPATPSTPITPPPPAATIHARDKTVWLVDRAANGDGR
jgi:6-phosphogluconolactonase